MPEPARLKWQPRKADDERRDPVCEYLDSWSLDMLAPITDGPPPSRGGLLARWDDVTIAELPKPARACALSVGVAPAAILAALLEPHSITDACAAFVEGARLGSWSAEIALLRAGLLSERIPTLQEIGHDLGLTRERVRQIEGLGKRFVDETQLDRHPIAHTLRAWFDLHPQQPLCDTDVGRLSENSVQERCLRLALRILDYPHLNWGGDIWTATEGERRACEAMLETTETWAGAADWTEAAERTCARAPGVQRSLDLEQTVRRIGAARDFGLGLDGRIVSGHERVIERVVRKIVTYLLARATPIPVAELATVIAGGQHPFEAFLHPQASVAWLEECARGASDLAVLDDGRIGLAAQLAGRAPTGRVGILYSLASRHGEPMRMQDLCDQAAGFGLSRNQTGMLIHSRRAACLFMLSRGVVGLVGRDEGADPEDHKAVTPAGRRLVRPGHEIGYNEQGALAADIEVRRSIREQGFGLPWPFSLALLDDAPQLALDGERHSFARRANGDLDLPGLVPSTVVRLALRRGSRGSVLSIETGRESPLAPIRLTRPGAIFPIGLPPSVGRPGWIAEFERRHDGESFVELDDVFAALPRALPERRRVYALHALITLGIVASAGGRWKVGSGRSIPSMLATAFARAVEDPLGYPVLLGDDRAATAWLVRAAWLTPNVGWSVVRYNDLSRDVELDLPNVDVPRSLRPREAALMRIVETAEQAADWVAHPGEQDLLGQSLVLARRYLTALGFTAYEAVRELGGTDDALTITYSAVTDGELSGVWVLKRVGVSIEARDLSQAKREAKAVGCRTWAVLNGVRIEGSREARPFAMEIRAAATDPAVFDRLVELAANPSELSAEEDVLQ